MEREENTEYILSLSYGKDSLACLEAIKQLGYPLDRIVHVELWATDTMQADLPEMVDFKKHADGIIKERYGIEVEHICATSVGGGKLSYEKQFYSKRQQGDNKGKIYGFPCVKGAWCNSRLKVNALNKIGKYKNKKVVHYLGIACDETLRVERHSNSTDKVLPLVDIGWDEAYCKAWCKDNDLLSPIYTKSARRGGCWFCHNQSIDQLRILRKDNPKLWNMLMRWDLDSPVTFKPNNHTVHDFEKRFDAEDKGIIKANDKKFRWKQLEELKEDE